MPSGWACEANMTSRTPGGHRASPALTDPSTAILDIVALYKERRGVGQLYAWQEECLLFEQREQRRNLIYTSPTGGGKTLVAEILLTRAFLEDKKDAIFVLPYVALVEEKVRELSVFENDVYIEAYCGHQGRIPPTLHRKKPCLYIATIEKANGLVNWLIENKKLERIGLIVLDELHFLSEDSHRGAVLEGMLCKALHAGGSSVQVVGMSATLNNMSQIQQFMNARCFQASVRANPLDEYLVCDDYVYTLSGEPVRQLDLGGKRGADGVAVLVSEIVDNGSCLVFCPTKDTTESTATALAQVLRQRPGYAPSEQVMARISNEAHVTPTLRRLLACGVGYHHGGLTSDERVLVEDMYRSRLVCVLVSTSTLAAGVKYVVQQGSTCMVSNSTDPELNETRIDSLPAQRVIIRSPYLGKGFMTKSRYTQMAGRAGRAGMAARGDSYLVLKTSDVGKIRDMVEAGFDQVVSRMEAEGLRGLQRLILDGVCLGLVAAQTQLSELIGHTLLAAQATDLAGVCARAVSLLVDGGALQISEVGGTIVLAATPFGRAIHRSCMDVHTARLVYGEFLCAQDDLVISSELHLLYLISPVEGFASVKVDPYLFIQAFGAAIRNEQDVRATEHIGITEQYLTVRARSARATIKRKTSGHPVALAMTDEQVYRRFYFTLVLYDLIRERTPHETAQKFQMTPGEVQALQQNAAVFGSMMAQFVQELQDVVWGVKVLVKQLVLRLYHGVREELTPLMEISGVKQRRARQLYDAGYKDISELAAADVNVMVAAIENLHPSQAQKIVKSARRLLVKQAEEILEQAGHGVTYQVTEDG